MPPAPRLDAARQRFSLTQPGQAHLIGAAGTGMRALWELLVDAGWTVTGSDREPSASVPAVVDSHGGVLHRGHAASNVPRNADVVVHSPAIPGSNPERVVALRHGIRTFELPELLGELMADQLGISIAGTHGKSTTTALLGTILQHAGRSSACFGGAMLRDDGRSKHPLANRSGWCDGIRETSRPFVVESCEFRRNFLHLSPRWAVVLGTELDHPDCFDSQNDCRSAFEAFAAGLPRDGRLWVNADDPASRLLRTTARGDVQTLSVIGSADWTGQLHRRRGPASESLRMRCFRHGQFRGEFSLPIHGRHHALNALAAIAVATECGIESDAIREAFALFPGLSRRMEPVGNYRGMTIFDDYAHHPTAISAALTELRERFPHRRLVAVVQPHQLSRLRAMFDQFASALLTADAVIVTPVYAARETDSPAHRTAAEDLSRAVRKGSRETPRTWTARNLDHATTLVDDVARPGDVLVFLGAGDINRIPHEFHRRLRGDHQAG